jgi:hypothetical protein
MSFRSDALGAVGSSIPYAASATRVDSSDPLRIRDTAVSSLIRLYSNYQFIRGHCDAWDGSGTVTTATSGSDRRGPLLATSNFYRCKARKRHVRTHCKTSAHHRLDDALDASWTCSFGRSGRCLLGVVGAIVRARYVRCPNDYGTFPTRTRTASKANCARCGQLTTSKSDRISPRICAAHISGLITKSNPASSIRSSMYYFSIPRAGTWPA